MVIDLAALENQLHNEPQLTTSEAPGTKYVYQDATISPEIQETLKPPTNDFTLKDSGDRRDFGTGAVRDMASGKGRYDLIPPSAIFALSRVYEEGARKYAVRNWEKGIPLSCFIDSGLRHIFKHLEGYRDEKHMAQASWNLLAYIWTATQIERGLLPDTLNDLPNHLGEGKPTVL